MLFIWRGIVGGRPGEKGEEGLREAEEEGWEAGFPRWREAGERNGKITQHCAIFCIRRNAKRREPTNTEREQA